MKKTVAILAAITLLISSMPIIAYAAEPPVVSYTLDVKNGDDIGDAFTSVAKKAKGDTSGTIYKITIPAGSYTSSSQLKLWSNTYVYMNGVTIKHSDAKNNMMRFGNLSDLEASPVSGYNAFSNIRIYGGTFDGGGFKKAILQIGHSKDILFSGVTFKNVKDAHMLEIGGCSDITIENCTFKDFTGSWSSTTNNEALQFEIVTTTNNHFGGYPNNNDETPCKNVIVKGCTFKNLQRGVGTHTGIANSYFTNMNFSNNTFENITGFAIIATNYKNAVISGNTIKNCGCGILFRTVELAHNNFYASSVHSNSHTAYENMGSKITNNAISVSKGYKADYGNVAYGIQLAGEKLSSKTGTVPAGDFRCSGVTVSGNTVALNCTGYGIWLCGAVGNTISNNKVTCNLAVKKAKGGTGDGIRLQLSEKNTINANTITNSTTSGYDTDLNGITLCESSNSNTFSSNIIKKAKKDGIRVEKSNKNKFIKNKISNSGRDGIHIEYSNSIKVNSNTITSSKRNGLSLKNVKKSTFSKNTVKSCKSDGFHLEKSTSNKLTSNTVSKAGRDGIHLALSSDSCTLTSNKITSSKRNGISLYTKTKKLTFTKNTIKSSKAYGISADKKNQIKKDSKNKITKSGKRARSWKK